MEDIRPDKAYYAVYLSIAKGAKPACLDVRRLLPHGSGYDGNWYVHVTRAGTVNATVEFHTMDDNGYYGSYINLTARFRRISTDVVLTSTRGGGWRYGDMFADDMCTVARQVGADTNHTHIVAGYCHTCGHWGSDCIGETSWR